MTGSGPGLFRGVNRAVFAAALGHQLRVDGLTVTMPAIERLAASLGAVEGPTAGELYWLCRLSLVSDRADLDRFDRTFSRLFGPVWLRTPDPPTPAGHSRVVRREEGDQLAKVRRLVDGQPVNGSGLPWDRPSPSAAPDDPDDRADRETTLPELLAAREAVPATTPFDRLDPEELARVTELIERAGVRWATRTSRRHRSGRGRALDLRRTLTSARRTGGEPLRLHRRRRIRRPRPLVALLDVSGSMESYSRVYLHLLRVLARAGRAEVFAFSTSLTRLTPVLRHRSADEAIERADEAVGDRFSGTRIATVLTELLTDRRWAALTRGAVVLVVSDGWDTDPPELLDRRMAALQRRSFRMVWVNPRAAAVGFRPEAAGMAVALPHCDRFLPGHHLDALGDVLRAVSAERA